MKPTIALVYDFDGTLSPGNMQEFGFIQATGLSAEEFWDKSASVVRQQDADSVLCYMKLMLDEARYAHVGLTRENFRSFGPGIEYFKGVMEWFDLINSYGEKIGVNIEHYINSSGLKEIIEGTVIAGNFKHIYASSFLYDVNGVAEWPAVAIDFTAKTQVLFLINKGIENIRDNREVNKFLPEDQRPVPFRRMIYFGDGETDIPCMSMVKRNGGYSIAVFNPDDESKQAIAEKLIEDGRVNFARPADYSEGGKMHQTVVTILNKIKSDYDFDNIDIMLK